MEDLDKLFVWLSTCILPMCTFKLQPLLEKGPQTEQGNNLTRDFLDLHLLASDTIVGKFTAIVVETMTFVPNVGCY